MSSFARQRQHRPGPGRRRAMPSQALSAPDQSAASLGGTISTSPPAATSQIIGGVAHNGTTHRLVPLSTSAGLIGG